MSVLFITHDLARRRRDRRPRRRDAQRRDPRAGASEARSSSAPQRRIHAGAAAVPAALDRRPAAAGDRRLHGGGAHAGLAERRAACVGRPIVLDVRTWRRASIARGLFGRREFKAVKDVSFKLPKGKTLGLVGESGSGKTTRRAHADAPARGAAGEALFDGHGTSLSHVGAASSCRTSARIQIIFQNPVRVAQPALHRRRRS